MKGEAEEVSLSRPVHCCLFQTIYFYNNFALKMWNAEYSRCDITTFRTTVITIHFSRILVLILMEACQMKDSRAPPWALVEVTMVTASALLILLPALAYLWNHSNRITECWLNIKMFWSFTLYRMNVHIKMGLVSFDTNNSLCSCLKCLFALVYYTLSRRGL